MKAVTFIPFQCRSRESHRPAESDSLKLTGAWTPTTKHRPGRSQGGIDHFTLTLSLMGRGSGSLPPEQGPVIIHHLEKSLLETPALPRTVAIRCLALSSGTVSNRSLRSWQREFGCCQKEGQERSPHSGGGVIHHQHWKSFPVGMGGRWERLMAEGEAGRAGSVTSSRADVPQHRKVFGYDTCVCMYI